MKDNQHRQPSKWYFIKVYSVTFTMASMFVWILLSYLKGDLISLNPLDFNTQEAITHGTIHIFTFIMTIIDRKSTRLNSSH